MTQSAPKLLISSCLMGDLVKYNGGHNLVENSQVQQFFQSLEQQGRLIKICPEVFGGLTIPREKCELVPDEFLSDQAIGFDFPRVISESGTDCSEYFKRGAIEALRLTQQHNIRYALLKARSPSCGKGRVYSGDFSGKLIDGSGVTASLLSHFGVKVFDELEIASLVQLINTI